MLELRTSSRDLARQLEHVVVEQEEARQPEDADHAELLLEAAGRLAAARRARIPLSELASAQLRELAVGLRVLRAGIAVAEVAREVELDRSASRAVSTTASRCSGKRAAISAGGAITDVLLPRRCGSVWSSVESRRAATNASWRRARSGWWEWTLPVATHGTPSRSASSASARLRARSRRQNGRCSSTRKRSGPNAASRRRPSRSASRSAPRSTGGEQPVARAAGQAHEALRVRLESLERERAAGVRSRGFARVPSCAAVSRRQRLR